MRTRPTYLFSARLRLGSSLERDEPIRQPIETHEEESLTPSIIVCTITLLYTQ